MGGDGAPEAIVRGALRAARQDGVEILLVGAPDVLRGLLPRRQPKNIRVVGASEVIQDDEPPVAAIRRKRDSSLRRACELVVEGEADAFVSFGNSGAILAASTLILGRLPGVERPAFTVLLPTPAGQVVLLDVGANIDCRPSTLVQFAAMGEALARRGLGREAPRVALLSNGIESSKGSKSVREARAVLHRLSSSFSGYIEPNQLFEGDAEVVVCDGFAGNLMLKFGEGLLGHLEHHFRLELVRRPKGGLSSRWFGALWRRIGGRLDYRTLGGGLVLGVDGCAVVGHGRSGEHAVAAALGLAVRLERAEIVQAVRAGLEEQALALAEAGSPAVDEGSR